MRINLKDLSHLGLSHFVKLEVGYFKWTLVLISLLCLHHKGFSQCDSTSSPPIMTSTVSGMCGGSGGNNRLMTASTTLAVFEFSGNGPFKLEMKKATDSTYMTIANAIPSKYTVGSLDTDTLYDVRVTDQCGKTAVNQIQPQQLPEGGVNTDPPCVGQTYTLSAEDIPGATYSWTKNGLEVSTSRDFIFAPYSATDDGTYIGVIYLGGCISKVINVNLNSANCDHPLPVTLISFTAKQVEKDIVLSWSTSMEINSDRFEIENSFDGKSWQMVGTVFASKESSSVKMYHYIHQNPTPGFDLYRLRMIDQDLSFAFSHIQQAKIGNTGNEAFLFPNPVSESLFLNPDLKAEMNEVVITDANGRIVYAASTLPDEGINVKKLSAGIHNVRIKQKNGIVLSSHILIVR